ncbi:hypothetical protein J4414_04280 [Candidatus Woesearchaeota archaeon]|nr:hypothetical protein [Candidatus Woesearchaeota archaeon]
MDPKQIQILYESLQLDALKNYCQIEIEKKEREAGSLTVRGNVFNQIGGDKVLEDILDTLKLDGSKRNRVKTSLTSTFINCRAIDQSLEDLNKDKVLPGVIRLKETALVKELEKRKVTPKYEGSDDQRAKIISKKISEFKKYKELLDALRDKVDPDGNQTIENVAKEVLDALSINRGYIRFNGFYESLGSGFEEKVVQYASEMGFIDTEQLEAIKAHDSLVSIKNRLKYLDRLISSRFEQRNEIIKAKPKESNKDGKRDIIVDYTNQGKLQVSVGPKPVVHDAKRFSRVNGNGDKITINVAIQQHNINQALKDVEDPRMKLRLEDILKKLSPEDLGLVRDNLVLDFSKLSNFLDKFYTGKFSVEEKELLVCNIK